MKTILITFALIATITLQAQKTLVKQIDVNETICDRITNAITVRYGYVDSVSNDKGVKVLNITKQEFVQNFVLNYLINETKQHETATAGSVATQAKGLEFETTVKEPLKPIIKKPIKK
jgi:hypothetical protein